MMFFLKNMNADCNPLWPELLDCIPLGVIILDLRTEQISYCNRAMTDILQTIQPLDYFKIKKYFLGTAIPDPNIVPKPQTVIMDEKKIGFTAYSPNPQTWLLLANEISEKDRQEQITATTNVMSAIDFTFFSLAHEMGNPINSIKMTLEVLINNFREYDTKTKLEYLGNLHAEFNRLEELLKAIKSFNMFDHLSKKATNVQALLNNLLQLMKAELENKGIEIQVHFPEVPSICLCDPRALQQSLLNIMTNSIDALAGRSKPLIAIEVGKSVREVAITIRDNGCGIPDEKKNELFMPFSSSKVKGTGLGLAITKKLLAQMNGTIELTSLFDQGTIVLIRLPLAPPDES